MSELYSSKYIIKILETKGFVFVSQKGSHTKYRKKDRTVIIPHPKKEIPMGTFRSILRQSGLNSNDFAKRK
jgi:predicted RNA binding protein YcfA (HicA-like mRNA interferase family)